LGSQAALGLAVGIKAVACPLLHPALHFTVELEKQPACLFSDPRVHSVMF